MGSATVDSTAAGYPESAPGPNIESGLVHGGGSNATRKSPCVLVECFHRAEQRPKGVLFTRQLKSSQ